jgi:hypothetical protein
MCGVRDPFGYKCWMGMQIGTQIGMQMQAMSADKMQEATLATHGPV